MKLAICKLQSVSPYSQSRYHQTEKLNQELADDYERRTWRHKMHVGSDGFVFIPPMSFSNSIKEAAGYLSLKIPGQRNATFTKHFDAGVLVMDPLVLPLRPADVEGEWLHMNADGKRGSGTRVARCFPKIPQWEGAVSYLIGDDIITPEIFERVVRCSGSLIGIGRFRPRNRGYYGRFIVNNIDWKEDGIA